MKHRRLRTFRQDFQGLPKEIQRKAVKAFQRFKENPGHPSLHVQKIPGTDIWYGRVDQAYRWTFHYEHDRDSGETICVHRRLGTHAVFESP